MLNKKTVFVLVALLLATGTLFAVDYSNAKMSSMYQPGNFIVEAGVAIEGTTAINSAQLPIYPAAEIILFKPLMGDYAFLDIGLAAKARIGIPLSNSVSFGVGLAPLATIHLGLRGLDHSAWKFLDGLDFFIQMGVGFDFLKIGTNSPWLSYVASAGVNYFINDNIRIGLSWTDWGWNTGVCFSFALKFGAKPPVKGFGSEYRK